MKTTDHRLLWKSLIKYFLFVVISMGIIYDASRIIYYLNPQNIYHKDFLQDYLMSKAVINGVNPYLSSVELAKRLLGINTTINLHPSPHTPFIPFVVLPLSIINYKLSIVLWLILEISVLIFSVFYLFKKSKISYSFYQLLLIFSLFFLWYPVQDEFILGQFTLIQLLMLLFARRLLLNKNYYTAGILIGLAVLIKPFLWPMVLLFLIWKNWRALFASIATLLTGFTISFIAIGTNKIIPYFFKILPSINYLYKDLFTNISLFSLGTKFFLASFYNFRWDANGYLKSTILPLYYLPDLGTIINFILPILVLLIAFLYLKNTKNHDMGFGLMICVSILISPVSWYTYLSLLIIPAFQLLEWLFLHKFPKFETRFLVLLALLFFWVDPLLLLSTYLSIYKINVQNPNLNLSFVTALFSTIPTILLIILIFFITKLKFNKEYTEDIIT